MSTPLGIIKWYIESIKSNDYIHTNTEKALDYLNEVEKSNERLLELVRNMLAVAHIDEKRAKNDPKPLDVSQVLSEILQEMKIVADNEGISMQAILPKIPVPKVTIDSLRFREVVENILSNAIKYSPENGNVKVALEVGLKELLISVKDNGIGIPNDATHGMFTRFFRADNAVKTDTQGNGLGLYVVKSYVVDWGGKIWYESVENKGTTFFVTIPLEY